MTLEPADQDSRVWFLFADGEEEKTEWMQFFTQATKVASNYVNPDPVVRKTFAKVYARQRRAIGLPAKVPQGSEQEALADTLLELANNIQDVQDTISAMDAAGKKAALKYLRALTLSLATSSWKEIQTNSAKIKLSVEGVLRKSMTNFLEGEEKVMGYMKFKGWFGERENVC